MVAGPSLPPLTDRMAAPEHAGAEPGREQEDKGEGVGGAR